MTSIICSPETVDFYFVWLCWNCKPLQLEVWETDLHKLCHKCIGSITVVMLMLRPPEQSPGQVLNFTFSKIFVFNYWSLSSLRELLSHKEIWPFNLAVNWNTNICNQDCLVSVSVFSFLLLQEYGYTSAHLHTCAVHA